MKVSLCNWKNSSVVLEYLPRMCEVLCSTPSTRKKTSWKTLLCTRNRYHLKTVCLHVCASWLSIQLCILVTQRTARDECNRYRINNLWTSLQITSPILLWAPGNIVLSPTHCSHSHWKPLCYLLPLQNSFYKLSSQLFQTFNQVPITKEDLLY